jgi:hypothetical protein
VVEERPDFRVRVPPVAIILAYERRVWIFVLTHNRAGTTRIVRPYEKATAACGA